MMEKRKPEKESDEDLLREKDLEEKARKRTRGPYRTSGGPQLPVKSKKS
jgi:hypothetical protein